MPAEAIFLGSWLVSRHLEVQDPEPVPYSARSTRGRRAQFRATMEISHTIVHMVTLQTQRPEENPISFRPPASTACDRQDIAWLDRLAESHGRRGNLTCFEGSREEAAASR